MNTIRAKFICTNVQSHPTTGEKTSESVELNAVWSGNAEDNSFASATLSATVTKTINNPAAFGFFVPGQKYYADFSLAVEPVAASPVADASAE